MAAGDTKTGAGSTIALAVGTFTANVEAINWDGIERGSIETTHLGTTTAKEFIEADLFDPGELSLDIQFKSNEKPPIDAAASTLTLTVRTAGLGDGTTWAATAFMTGFSFGPLTQDDKMTGSATFKVSGDITVT